MLSVKELSMVYEALLAPPMMTDGVKITLHITRKQVLLLSKVIELGLSISNENGQAGLLSIVDVATLQELQRFSAEMLQKAGLTEMNDKLNALSIK
jgi:hypothetical protein